MNKSLRNLVFASLAMLTLAPMTTALQPQVAHAETTTWLTIGMRGTEVSQLQSDLKTLGYFTYPNITGYFGSITAQSVKDFQMAYGLHVDGIVGPLTQQSLSHALIKKSIVDDSTQYLGIPYQWGGTTTAGFDCSGFVYYLYSTHGVSITRSTSTQMYTWGTSVEVDQLMPGDLVFYALTGTGQVSHVGLYLGNGQFISALSSKGIAIQSLTNSYWASHYVGAKRIW